MKVVKITKPGVKEHFLILFEEPYSNDDIDCLVYEWYEKKYGICYGTMPTWVFIEDLDLIKTILHNRMFRIERKIERKIKKFKTEKTEIEKNITIIKKIK
jgi:hypothetical protein